MIGKYLCETPVDEEECKTLSTANERLAETKQKDNFTLS